MIWGSLPSPHRLLPLKRFGGFLGRLWTAEDSAYMRIVRDGYLQIKRGTEKNIFYYIICIYKIYFVTLHHDSWSCCNWETEQKTPLVANGDEWSKCLINKERSLTSLLTIKAFMATSARQDNAFSPMIEAMSVVMKNKRQKVAGSWNTKIPTSTVPTAPMPVHTG